MYNFRVIKNNKKITYIMIITKEIFMGSIMYCVSYKGFEVFNRDIKKAIYQSITGLILK